MQPVLSIAVSANLWLLTVAVQREQQQHTAFDTQHLCTSYKSGTTGTIDGDMKADMTAGAACAAT